MQNHFHREYIVISSCLPALWELGEYTGFENHVRREFHFRTVKGTVPSAILIDGIQDTVDGRTLLYVRAVTKTLQLN